MNTRSIRPSSASQGSEGQMRAEIVALRQQIETLHLLNEGSLRRALDAEQVMAAFARGEIDAVALDAAATPVLLQAAQDKLHRSQQLLRAIFDGALEPMVLTDVEGNFVDANPAACQMCGLSLEDLIGKSYSVVSGVDALDEAAYQRFREQGHVRGTFTFTRPDATERVLEFSTVSNVSPGLDLSVMRDITERVAAEGAVQRSEARFRTLTEKSTDVIALRSSQGHVLYLSPSINQMVGWTPQEMRGSEYDRFVYPQDRERVAEMRDRLMAGAAELALDFRVVHRDGSIRWVEATGRNLCADPNIEAIVTNLRDVTERVQAQEASRENLRRLEDAQAIAHVGSWTSGISLDGHVELSREAARIFGVPEDAPLALTSFYRLVHPDDQGRFRHAWRDAVERGAPADLKHRIVRGDGAVRWVHERGVLERDALGAPVRMVGTVQDVTDQHDANEALRASEAEFRLLAEAMPQIVWISLPDGANIYLNEHWTRYTGLTLEESMGRGWLIPFHPDDGPRVALAWQSASDNESAYSIECRLRRADGAYRWWLIRGVPARDAAGRIVKWFGTCTDIDTLKQGEERLRLLHDIAEVMLTQGDPMLAIPAALQVLAQYLHACHCAIAIVDADGEHCTVAHEYSDRGTRMLGRVPISDLVGRHVTHASSDDVAVVVRDLDTDLDMDLARVDADAFRAQGVHAWICRALVSKGALRAIMIVQHSGSRDWTPAEIAMVQDVGDRCWVRIEKSAAEDKLRESEALLRITGRAARLGGWSLSLLDQGVMWSDEVFNILELPPGTMPSLDRAIAYYAPEFRESIQQKMGDCARDGTPFDVEVQVITETGRRVWVRVLGYAERSASGAITMLRGAFQDIDDRRKLQDQYRQAQKMEAVGRLAGGVAHDFNNLLSVILSYADFAIDALKVGDPLRDDIEEIRKAGTRATGLTRQLLAFSRQQVLAPRVIDLNEIVDSMKPMLVRLLGEDINLTVVASPQRVRLALVDPTQVEQILMNLAVNARDAMPKGGKLSIETADVLVDDAFIGKPAEVPAGGFVMLAVKDNGEGMSEATRARAFEPFFTTKPVGKGTGLGLATVFGIVQQSGGFVTMHSEPGLGTTFKLYFPRTDRAADPIISVPPASAGLGGTETILLVEDEDQVRGAACAILRRNGYNVLDTSNGGEAFLVSNDFAHEIHLLLTDVVMPRVSGRRLAEQLGPLRPQMKILFVSGYTDDTIIHHGVLDAGVEFLQKPFTPHALLKKVREVLDTGRRLGLPTLP